MTNANNIIAYPEWSVEIRISFVRRVRTGNLRSGKKGRKKMSKKLVALLLSSVITAGLVGCGSSEGAQTNPSGNVGTTQTASSDTSGSEGGYTTDSITINIWDSNQQAGLQAIADDWSANSGVKVNIEGIATSGGKL